MSAKRRTPPPKKLSDFLEELDSKDMTLKQWAQTHGVDLEATYQVASGRAKGSRGKARLVMRAMGLPLPGLSKKAALAAND